MSILAFRLALALTAALCITRPAAGQLFGGTAAQDCATAIAGDVRDHSTVSVVCGIPGEKVAEFMRLAVSGRPGDYADLLRRLDAMIPADARLRVEAIARFFTILGEADVPPEHLTDRLVEIAGRYQELLAQLKVASGDDPEVVRLKAEAEAALARGDLDRADVLLQELEGVQERAADRQAMELAATKAQRAGLALTRLRYAEAASLFAEAAGRMPPGHEEERLGYLEQEAEALYRQGDERGDNAALMAAVERYRILARLRPRERVPLDWARTQNNLGNALQTLGAREAGTARLEEAVQAYRAALEEWTRERVPLDWALTQNNLGNALWTLGAREAGTARLEEAVQAFRAALEEWTRERVPLQWAGTQMNLGNALRALGEREAGTARLEEAVQAYRAALEERTRERAPLDWARTQMNLGAALWTLGEREAGTARLEEAVQAYDGALAVFKTAGAGYYAEMAQRNHDQAAALLRERQIGGG
jgi:tetratricopeptide (TPR) repeat protein